MDIGLHAQHFQEHQSLLYGIAYRMLGSYSEAEDAVQDAYIRWQGVNLKQVDSPAAFLASTVSRLCIDKQRRRKVEKLLYTGPWLPEPISDEYLEEINDPAYVSEQAESVSLAFMTLLEKLGPVERAVFVLREAFDLPHDDIADMLGIRSAHSRQLYRRAKTRLNSEPSASIDEDAARNLVDNFLAAAMTGDLTQLHELMAEDIIAYSDGGGRASAAIIPLVGKDRVTTVFLHLLKKNAGQLAMEWSRVNGELALLFREGDKIHSVQTFVMSGGKLHRAYVMRNPEKLHYVH